MANGKTKKDSFNDAAAFKIGERLREGNLTTIVFGFDRHDGTPLRIPESLFIGKASFKDQDKLIAKTNRALGLKGNNILTRLSALECTLLAREWGKVAPPALTRTGAEPSFWGTQEPWNMLPQVYSGVYGGSSESSFPRYVKNVPAAFRHPIRKI